MQLLIKITFLSDLRITIDIISFVSNFHLLNSKSKSRDYDLCSKYSKYAERIVKIVPSIYIVTVVVFQIPSYVDYFITGNIRPPYGAYLPSIDLNERSHVFLLYLFSALESSVAFGVSAYDSFICIVFANISMISKIIERELVVLGATLGHIGGHLPEKDINRSFLKVIEMHLKYNE